jgi:tellurite resistance protein
VFLFDPAPCAIRDNQGASSMRHSLSRKIRRTIRQPVVIDRPSRRTVDGMVKAASIIACADGRLDAAERRSLIALLRRHGALAEFGRRPLLDAFDQAVARPEHADLAALCVVADGLRPLANTPAAQLIAMTAVDIAMADGVTWPQEMAMLQVIRDRLGLAARRETGYA